MRLLRLAVLLPALLAFAACGSNDGADASADANAEVSADTMAAIGGGADGGAALAAVKARGVEIAGSFDAPGELTGYAGRLDDKPVTVYVTGDGELALMGTLLNAKGEDVGQQALYELVIKPHADRMWAKLKSATWVAEGADSAPQTLYAFSDPNCPYCHLFWQRVRPWVEAGQVQVRYVLVGVIARSSPHKAAAILTADSPLSALLENEHKFKAGGITPVSSIPVSVQSDLVSNARLMREFGLTGTPGIVLRGDDGRLQKWGGVPSTQLLTATLGELNSG